MRPWNGFRVSDGAGLVRSSATVLVATLERAGWQLLSFEVDVDRATARVEILGSNGRLVTLDACNGRATLTREVVSFRTETCGAGGARGRGFRAERLRAEFIGRSQYPGLRSAMRGLAHYLADNAPVAALPRETARKILAPTLDAWV